MDKNQLIELDIASVQAEGMGVGKHEDFVVFAAGALAGERIRAQLTKVKKRYAYARIVELLTTSPHRLAQADICPVAAPCGGCQFQHCAYEAQLDIKTQIVRDALARIGRIENAPVNAILGADNPFAYRNKAQYPVENERMGFYAPRSHRIVETENCNIQHPAVQAVVCAIQTSSLSKQNVRHVMVRVGDEEVMVVLVVKNDFKKPDRTAWVDVLSPVATTILLNENNADTNVILGKKFHLLHGSGYIYEHIGDFRYRISPRAFFQVNTAQARVLFDTVRRFGAFTGRETVIDAHAGSGGMGLYVARQAARVICVESVAEDVADGRYNATLNGCDNVTFVCDEAENAVPPLLQEGADAVILDPPRKGCSTALLDALVAVPVPKVLYCSCDPATLARDLRILIDGGYRLVEVQPVDMFPMTGHVESVALLCRHD